MSNKTNEKQSEVLNFGFTGTEVKKESAGKKSGSNSQIAELLKRGNGASVQECGELLYGDKYDKDLFGKPTRTVIRATRASLKANGYKVFKIKTPELAERTIAVKPEHVEALHKGFKQSVGTVISEII